MTTRRGFLGHLGGLGAVGALGLPRARAWLAPATGLALPTAAHRAWADLEIGMFVHFGPNTWQDEEYDTRTTPLDRITPDIDTDQWADTAVALGARYIVMVAKHVGGFCMWQTKTNPYGIAGTPWKGGKGDVMADLARSCKARNLRLGVYLSPRDDSLGAGQSGRCDTPAKQAVYDRICRQQLTEVLTRYGEMVEIWFDGSSVVPVGDILARHARNSMIFQGPHATIRWVGNEDGFAPYPAWNSIARADAKTGTATSLHGDPEGDTWLPNEVDVSIRRPNWFWHTDNEKNLLTTAQLMEIYYRSVGRGCQLLLNMPPDRTGRIPAPDAARVKEFGDEVRRRFGAPLGTTHGRAEELILDLGQPRRIDHVILAEDLAGGERVRRYTVDFGVGDEWIPVATGTAIGHKRIQPVAPTHARRLRLTARGVGVPMIRTFAAFDTGATPPDSWGEPATAWAEDEAGKWTDGGYDVDLADKIKAPAVYRLRFVGIAGMPVKTRPVLLMGGTASPQLVKPVGRRADSWTITIPEIGKPIRIRGEVDGAPTGTILLHRI